MEKIKKEISKWLIALFAVVMVLGSLVGCSDAEVDKALDVAIEVLEVVESLEAETEGDGQTVAQTLVQASEQASRQASEQTPERVSEQISDQTLEQAPKAKDSSIAESTADSSEDVEVTVEEDGHYTSKEEVALYIHTYGKLPSNYISKNEAEELGWKKKDGEDGQLHVVAPGMSIGGSYFGNYEGLLPEKKGRKYYECDINYVKGNRGAERIVYSNDGLIFYTGDHYETFVQLYPEN